ncbi:MAG TPA: hypothetical protein VIJ71_02350, partial [Mycobacteriales bacterium]
MAATGAAAVTTRVADRRPPSLATVVAPAPLARTPARIVPAGTTPSPTPTATPSPTPSELPAVYVAPLTSLVVPDLLFTGSRPLTAAQRAAVRALPGVASVVPVSVGAVDLAGGPVTALGVDPSSFRSVTPNNTALSDALWASVARGEMSATYDVATAQHLTLGSIQTLSGHPVRIGSFADLRMPG